MMVRIGILALAFCSPFFFAYPYTLLLSFLASLFVAPVGVLVGMLTDVLYSPHLFTGIPVGTLLGALVSLVAFVVGRFVRARIIEI